MGTLDRNLRIQNLIVNIYRISNERVKIENKSIDSLFFLRKIGTERDV